MENDYVFVWDLFYSRSAKSARALAEQPHELGAVVAFAVAGPIGAEVIAVSAGDPRAIYFLDIKNIICSRWELNRKYKNGQHKSFATRPNRA